LEEEELDVRENEGERDAEEREEEVEGAGVGDRIIISRREEERVREDESRYSCITGERGE
jgi:hypothetical protein